MGWCGTSAHLEQRPVRRQADVVHAFGVGRPQACALATCARKQAPRRTRHGSWVSTPPRTHVHAHNSVGAHARRVPANRTTASLPSRTACRPSARHAARASGAASATRASGATGSTSCGVTASPALSVANSCGKRTRSQNMLPASYQHASGAVPAARGACLVHMSWVDAAQLGQQLTALLARQRFPVRKDMFLRDATPQFDCTDPRDSTPNALGRQRCTTHATPVRSCCCSFTGL